MPELLTAWITLAVSADDMRRDITREFDHLDRTAGGVGRRIGQQLERAVGKSATTAVREVEGKLSERLGAKVGTAVGSAIAVGVVRPLSPAIRGVVALMDKAGADAGRSFSRRFEATAKVRTPPTAAAVLSGGSGGKGGVLTGALDSLTSLGGKGGMITGVIADVAKIAPPVIAAAGAFKVLSAGFDRLQAIDDARFKLRSLGNDTRTVDQIMKSALESVKGTAFGMDEAANTAATAVAAGIKPGQDLTKYLTEVADAAAIGQTSLADMGSIFNKVQTNGKAMTDDLQMLADRGLPIFTWLQNEYKVSGAELSKMVENGKVDAATFQRVVAANIGGAAKGMGQSLSGSIKNLSAGISRLGASILEPFFGLSGDALGKATEYIDKLTAAVKEHQPEIVSVASVIASKLTDMAGTAAEAFASLLRGFANVLEKAGPMVARFGGVLTKIGGMPIVGKLFPEIGDAGKALQTIGDTMASDDVINGLRNFSTTVDKAGENLHNAAGDVIAWGQRASDAMQFTKDLGDSIELLPDKKTIVLTDNSPEVIDRIDTTQYRIDHLEDGTVTITALTEEAERKANAWRAKQGGTPLEIPLDIQTQRAREALDRLVADAPKTISMLAQINTNVTPSAGPATPPASGNPLLVPYRAAGAIVPMVDGGLRQIRKPTVADIFAGRGAGTIFAEEETGGEAYIPLAPGKRGRSRRILAEVARLFGMTVMADGGITVEALKEFASGLGGRTYSWGAGNGDTFDTDCSGAQSTVANFITGGQGRFGTADEATALLSRGFQQGDPPAGIAAYWVGWRNGGPGGGHTAGTIVDPLGGNVNVEMGGRGGSGQYGSGAAGAADFPSRAWIALAGGDDPSASSSFTGGYRAATSKELTAAAGRTSSAATSKRNADQGVDDATYRRDKAQQRLDDAAAAGKDTTDAQHSLDVANRELADARDRQTNATDKLTTAQQDEADLKTKGKETALQQIKDSGGGNDASSFGQSLVAGLFQGVGLDGSVFSNLFDWPNMKSVLAVANWAGGRLQNAMAAESAGAGSGGGVGDFINPIEPPQALTPISRPDEPHPGSGAAPGPAGGPTYVVQGNVGMDPRALTQRFDSAHNQAWRRNMSAVRPGK
ncbi:MAG: tape measure protein [Mycobacterium sp.]